MTDASTRFAHELRDEATLREIEGVERVPLLPLAEFVAVVPAPTADEPAYVFVAWTADHVERPYPGTAIWRAALEHYLAEPDTGDPTRAVLRPVVEGCLRRFPSLAAWLAWDHPDRRRPSPPHPRAARSILPKLRWPW